MYKAPGFIQQMATTPVQSDKVCRIFSNLGNLIITAIELVGQKTVHFYRLLFQMQGIKNVLEDVKRKMLTHQTHYDFSHYEHLKTDLFHEIHQFLSISLNSHENIWLSP